MDQLAARESEDDFEAAMRRLAQREGVSLNKAALRLLRKGAGLSDDAERTDMVGTSLDHLIGSWTPTEADEIDRALADFETVDEASRA
ncbi:hypothetical protein [Candidatus Poriferisodalis sp.]|uniref:hypothetical protein n=1 Tax=Candidatus Poriferisodalis sp. TaxID=3101277 RepID=UPI003B59E0F0